jgi:hypothetical protein
VSLKARTFGHLVELPLTSGRMHTIDPDAVVEVGTPHAQPGVTIVRLRGQGFALYVRAEYSDVAALLEAALSARAC